MSYSTNTNWTEARCRRFIVTQLDRWNKEDWSAVGDYDFPVPEQVGGVEATVRFNLRGRAIVVSCDSQLTYGKNLRCVAFAIESMRMNEKRGIADTLARAYLQLEAPKETRDPYEVLGVRPDAEQEWIAAAYKVLAKKYHSDTGGEHADDAKFAELSEAYEKVTK